ncbi:MAG: hypothetical protein JWL62_3860 [Hyphomicrobiales bacterium]|nr:hypothetical protein [Hyphomicrobiales bacterium]
MSDILMQPFLIGLTALVCSTNLCAAQSRPPVHICVVAAGGAPECLKDPVPSILDDSTAARPRTYEFNGDGRVVPYRRR